MWRCLGLGTAAASGEGKPLTTLFSTHPTSGASLCFQLGTVGWVAAAEMDVLGPSPSNRGKKAALSCNIKKMKQNK